MKKYVHAQEDLASNKYFRERMLSYDDCYIDSYDDTTPLTGWHWIVGLKGDDDGSHWRGFSDDTWYLVKDMTDEEIYNTYPESRFNPDDRLTVDGYGRIVDRRVDTYIGPGEEVGRVDFTHKTNDWWLKYWEGSYDEQKKNFY